MCNSSLITKNFNSLTEPFSFFPFQLLGSRNRLLISRSATDRPSHNSSMKSTQIQPQLETLLSQNYEMERTTSISPILDIMESPTLEQLPPDLKCKENTFLQAEMELNRSKNYLKPIEDASAIFPSNNNMFPLPNINALPLSRTSAALLNHQPALPAFNYLTPRVRNISPVDFPLVELNRVGSMFPSFLHRRPRGEKRPIPDEQKDDKYYERRKRNNEAAKKSRDARKIREDRIAFRAAFLEQENSILRAQVIALRDELQTMRQLIGRNPSIQI